MGKIIFTGRQTDIESIIQVMDIGVLLTNINRHQEGISNVILEYMAMGKPVVVTRSGGTDEIVMDHQNGFIIPPADKQALKNQLELLIDSEEMRNSLGVAGRKQVIANFGIDRMISESYKLYESIVFN